MRHEVPLSLETRRRLATVAGVDDGRVAFLRRRTAVGGVAIALLVVPTLVMGVLDDARHASDPSVQQATIAQADGGTDERRASGIGTAAVVRGIPASMSLRDLAQRDPFPQEYWGGQTPLTPRQAELFHRLGVITVGDLVESSPETVARILQIEGGTRGVTVFVDALRAHLVP